MLPPTWFPQGPWIELLQCALKGIEEPRSEEARVCRHSPCFLVTAMVEVQLDHSMFTNFCCIQFSSISMLMDTIYVHFYGYGHNQCPFLWLPTPCPCKFYSCCNLVHLRGYSLKSLSISMVMVMIHVHFCDDNSISHPISMVMATIYLSIPHHGQKALTLKPQSKSLPLCLYICYWTLLSMNQCTGHAI